MGQRSISLQEKLEALLNLDFSRDVSSNSPLPFPLPLQQQAPKHHLVERELSKAYYEHGREKLSREAEEVVKIVERLLEGVESLRKDVSERGVRPHRKDLDGVQSQIRQSLADLERLSERMKMEKVKWKKRWKRKLDKVCEEQQFFTTQQTLVTDLVDDVQKASETFQLVEKCSEQRDLNSTAPSSVADKDALLDQIRALRPDHEGRSKAVEKMEKQSEEKRAKDQYTSLPHVP